MHVFDVRALTIVSGGQTGADRAALDFAIAHGIAHGGWCPRGRLAEDGPIPPRYELKESPSRKYAQRNRMERSRQRCHGALHARATDKGRHGPHRRHRCAARQAVAASGQAMT